MRTKYFPIVGLTCLSLLTCSISSAYSSNTIDAKKIISLTNSSRKKLDLAPLVESEKLDLAAKLKLNDMVAHHYFAHSSPQGTKPWFFFQRASYAYQAAGENLAINFYSEGKLQDAWMKSPSHRKNILNPKFTEIGIAEKEVEFNGTKTSLIVEYFGAPQALSMR